MRPLTTLALLLASILPAQATLSTHYSANRYLSATDGGVYFDLAVHNGLSLNRIDLNLLSAAGTEARVEVYVRPDTWVGQVAATGDWVRAGSGQVTAAGFQQASKCTLGQPIGLPPGNYGVALHIVGGVPAYGTAFGPRTYGNADLDLIAGGAALQFLSSTPFQWRTFSGALHYAPSNGPSVLATATPFGAGCNRRARSFCEFFGPGAFDLSGLHFQLTPNGNGGYDVTRSLASPITLPADATNLGLQRGHSTHVTLPAPMPYPGGSTAQLLVFADGRVRFTGTGLLNQLPEVPTAAALFASHPTFAVAWQDYETTATANVFATTNLLTGAVTITWWQLPRAGAPGSSNSFALTAHANGRLEWDIGTITNPAGPCVTGYAAAAPARNPGPRDLSAAVSFATAHDDPGLGLSTRGRPVLGTTVTLAVADRAPLATTTALGFAWPGAAATAPIDLGQFGAPGCALVLDPAVTCWRGLGGGAELAVTLPTAPALLGLRFDSQAATWAATANALGLVTSNGVALTMGSV